MNEKTSEHEFFNVSLKILLLNKKNEVLLLKSPFFSKYFRGKYDLPGGRIDKHEINTAFHKLIDREIREEAGKKIKYQLRPDPVALAARRYTTGKSVFYVLFEAKYLSGPIKISKEHTEFRWQKITKLNLKKFFHPSLQKLILNYFDWNPNT